MELLHADRFSATLPSTLPATGRRSNGNQRASERRVMALPARLTWKDQRGATRFASVVTRNVSEYGVYVECVSAVSIPLFRLVQFQLERDVKESEPVPTVLRHGRTLSAVYRVIPATPSGGRQGLALRLMVDPRRRPVEQFPAQTTARASAQATA